LWPPGIPDLYVSVNVSGRQVGEQGLRQFLTEHARSGDLASGSLRLELTESVLIEYTAALESDLARAVDLGIGIGIGIDDFGTGFASLTYLRQFPVTFLKIDRSFVSELDGGGSTAVSAGHPALVALILQLCGTLRLERGKAQVLEPPGFQLRERLAREHRPRRAPPRHAEPWHPDSPRRYRSCRCAATRTTTSARRD